VEIKIGFNSMGFDKKLSEIMYLEHLLSLAPYQYSESKPTFQISLFYPKIVLHLSLAQMFSFA